MIDDIEMPKFIIAPTMEVIYTIAIPSSAFNTLEWIMMTAQDSMYEQIRENGEAAVNVDRSIDYPDRPYGYPEFDESTLDKVVRCPECGDLPELWFHSYENGAQEYYTVGCNNRVQPDHPYIDGSHGDTIEEAYIKWVHIVRDHIETIALKKIQQLEMERKKKEQAERRAIEAAKSPQQKLLEKINRIDAERAKLQEELDQLNHTQEDDDV